MLQMLKDLNIPVILTSQVYSSFDGKTHPIGGSLLKRFGEQTIHLQEEDNKRQATVKETNINIPFIITDKGLIV